MSTAVVKANPQLPAHIAKLLPMATAEVMNEMTGGITSGFPIISYKGKVWRMRKSGEEILYLDANNNAMPTIDIILVQANPLPSKIFYEKQYEEGTNESPRCFSNDGRAPDQSVQNPIAKQCAVCPNNVWGSRITPAGKKSRACSDARRMAIVFAHDLTEKGPEADKYLLRVPPASLNPLKDYAEKVLAPRGIPFFAVVTRIGFDPTVAHPQFQFKPVKLLSEEETEAVLAIRNSEDTRRILAEAQEFPAGEAGVGEPSQAAAGAPANPVPPSTSPAAKPSKTKAAMRPATDEEAGAAAVTPAKPVAAAAPDPVDALFENPPAVTPAPAKPKAAKPKAAPAPVAPVEEAAEEEETPAVVAAPAAGKKTEEFDNLLDSILNG